MDEARNASIAPQHRAALPEVSWETINEPGACEHNVQPNF
jgi:hypothetical protein